MTKERVYILHKNGANSHYTGLKHLLSENDIELQYFEFCITSKIFKSITKLRFKLFIKQLKNILFFLNLVTSRNKKIVLGIAPFDVRLMKLLPFLKNHQVYYHSSWTYWDKTFHPNQKRNTPKLFETWKFFLEEKVGHHFVVTEQTKNQILANYKIDTSKISVVNHSLKPPFLKSIINVNRIKNSFIYLGRLLPQKGIEELLFFFKENPNCTLTIMGDGKLNSLVRKAASKHANIIFKGFSENVDELIKEIQSNEFIVVNSKKTHKWEELFGLIIIEGMSQGTIPVASNHSGPKEIITDDIGYLFNEGDVQKCLSSIISNGGFDQIKSSNCILESRKYSPKNIALNWKQILL